MFRNPLHPANGRIPFPLWQRALVFCATFFVCAEAGSYFSAPTGTYISFWMPAGLYVAVLLLNERRDWPWLVLAAFPANLAFDLFHGTRFVPILFFYVANTVQAVLGAWLVRRFVAERPTLATLKEFIGLLGFAGVLSTLPGAVIGAATLAASGLSDSFVQSAKVWWGSNAMAILLLSPFILTWLGRANAPRPGPIPPGRILEAALLVSLLIALTWHLFYRDQGIMSPDKGQMVLPLLWAALRFGPRGAAAANLLLSLLLAFFTARLFRGLTPVQIASGEYVFVLQMSLVVAALVSLIPAVVLGERDRTMANLRESEERFRNLTQAAFEGIGISENGRVVDANDQMLKMFGYEREEMIGRAVVDLVAPESRAIVAESIRAGREELYENRLLRRDGSSFHAEARARMVRAGGRVLRMTALRDITERKAAEEALRKSEEKFSKAFRASPDGLAISELATGRYIEVNEGYCRLYGHAREEMLGRTSVELGVWDNPEDRERLVRGLKTAGAVRDLELRTRTRTGELRIILLSAEPIELGGEQCLLSVLHDVTDRIQAEQALRESEEKFSKAFRTSPDMMSITDFDTDRYLEVNDAHENAFGFKREEVIGRTPFELGILTNTDAHAEITRALTAHTRVHNVEIETRTKNGRVLTLWHSAELIKLGGRLCVLRVSHDITEQRRAELALRQAQQRELQARAVFARDLLTAQERERQRLASELHDGLGQNLSIIKNRARLARQPPGVQNDTAAHLEAIERVASEAIAEARNLAHNLRPPHLEQVGLTESVRGLVLEVSQSSSIRFERRVENVDNLFQGEAATNVYRIVQEALANLVKHSQAQQATVTVERDVRSVRLRVADDGVGFDAQTTVARRGLGLTSISERARMLGGSFFIQSAPGEGTALTVELPIADAGADVPGEG